MTNKISLYIECRACKGTGIDRHEETDGDGNSTWVEQECVACSGSGRVEFGELRKGCLDDIVDKLDAIKAVVDAL